MCNLKVFNNHEHHRREHKHNQHSLENLFLFLYHIRLLSFSSCQVYKQIEFLQPHHSGACLEEQTNLAAVIAIYDDRNDNYQIDYGVTFYEILTSILWNEQV